MTPIHNSLRGLDRATYGDSLLIELANRLTAFKVSNCNRRQLYRYLRFYRFYPSIVETLSPQLKELFPTGMHEVKKVGTLSPQLHFPPDQIIHRLSYSHLELIVDLGDEFKRAFYEIECIRGNWSVRELKRQIGSLYYERSGLSRDKEKLIIPGTPYIIQHHHKGKSIIIKYGVPGIPSPEFPIPTRNREMVVFGIC